jgi:hypothetical protein
VPDQTMHQVAYTATDVERLKSSIDEFGFGCVPHAILPEALDGLRAEAKERFALALLAEQKAELSYKANVVSLGERAKELVTSSKTYDLLHTLFGEKFELVNDSSCLTYYGEGHHLGPHLDKPATSCLVTMIAYLQAWGPEPRPSETGLVLRVYGQDQASLSAACMSIPTYAGSLVLGRGSKFWHERPMLLQGEYVTAITGCYRPISPEG